MIIDMHRHLWSLSERYPQVGRPTLPGMKTDATTSSPQELVPNAERRGAEVVEEMQASGVDRSVVFLADYALRLGEGTLTVEGENRLHAELARQYPDRLVPFLGVDPRRPGGLELFRTGLDRWGMRGLKFHPSAGFLPHDPVCMPFYQLASERELPVLFHTGPFQAHLFSHTTQPVHLDTVAADFPKLTIIMAHSGLCWWNEALTIAWFKPNMVLELSMWQWTYLRDPREFVASIVRMRDTIGIERIVFGSDFPGLRRAMSLRDWVGVFRRLPDLAKEHGYRITEEEAQAILGGNAQRILGLKA